MKAIYKVSSRGKVHTPPMEGFGLNPSIPLKIPVAFKNFENLGTSFWSECHIAFLGVGRDTRISETKY